MRNRIWPSMVACKKESNMKKLLAVVLSVLALSLSANVCRAESVTVSSSTVTTIVGSNASRATVCLQNATTNPVYFSKYSSSATANAGMVLVSSSTVADPLCIYPFTGAIYGLAGAGASGTVKYFESLK